MEFSTPFDAFSAILQISLIDLLLSGDNAILIAMACAGLPPTVRRKAVILGTAAAVLFRVVLAFAATLALRAPYLKLFGAVLLVLIAIELLAGESGGRGAAARRDPAAGVWRAIALIVVADAVMSLDNVVAVAAAAQDNLLYLVLGLLISVPILVFSSLFVSRLLDAHPLVIDAGAALLGWIAGKTAVSDPAIAATLNAQSFGLVAAAPLLGALYVVLQGQRLRAERAGPAPARAERAAPIAALPDAAATPAHGASRAAMPARAAAKEAVAPRLTQAPAGAPAPEAMPAGDPASLLQRFSAMDLTVMAGVAVPLLGLIGMIVYLIVRALGSH